jgi:hypothetical protein
MLILQVQTLIQWNYILFILYYRNHANPPRFIVASHASLSVKDEDAGQLRVRVARSRISDDELTKIGRGRESFFFFFPLLAGNKTVEQHRPHWA